MEQAYLVARQVFLIFLYIAIGMICTKTGIIEKKAGKSLSNFSLIIVTPALIIRTFIRPMDNDTLVSFGLAFFLAFVYHAVATIGVVILIKKREDVRYRIERLGCIFSNCGYMAIPLITATLGEKGTFYAVAFICVFNICVWPLGVSIITGEKQISIRKIFINPGIIGTAIGFVVYFSQISPPAIFLEAMDNIVAFTTPLPMITTGIFLSGIKLKETITSFRIYYASFVRLIIFPVFMIAFIKIFHVTSWIPNAHDVVLACILGSACPAATVATQFPARYGLDSEYGAKFIAVSTLLSIVTLPLVTFIVSIFLIT